MHPVQDFYLWDLNTRSFDFCFSTITIESRKRNFSLDLENLKVSISLSTLDFQRILESEEYEKFEKRPFVIAHDKH